MIPAYAAPAKLYLWSSKREFGGLEKGAFNYESPSTTFTETKETNLLLICTLSLISLQIEHLRQK